MAEPTAGKVTLFAALAALVGPLAAEYSLILAGALVGGFAGLSIRTEPLPGWWAPMRHVLLGVLLALLLTPAGASVAMWALPAGLALSVDSALPVVALAIGAGWHRALTDWGPSLITRWLPRRSDRSDGGQ